MEVRLKVPGTNSTMVFKEEEQANKLFAMMPVNKIKTVMEYNKFFSDNQNTVKLMEQELIKREAILKEATSHIKQ